jgi:ubiquinol-cytochrome c reductase cytochrome b subunit
VVAIPLVLLGLVAAHIMALHEVARTIPTASRSRRTSIRSGHPRDGIPFHPYYTVKDTFGVAVFLLVFSVIVFFIAGDGRLLPRVQQLHPADPLKTPEHIAPGVVLHAVLRDAAGRAAGLRLAVPGVAVMGAATLILFLLPWLDRGKVKSIRYRGPKYKRVVRALHRLVPHPGLPRRRADHGVGRVPKGLPIIGGDYIALWVRARAHGRLLPLLPAHAVVHGRRPREARAATGDLVMKKISRHSSLPRLLAWASASGGKAPPRARALSTCTTRHRCSAARRSS